MLDLAPRTGVLPRSPEISDLSVSGGAGWTISPTRDGSGFCMFRELVYKTTDFLILALLVVWERGDKRFHEQGKTERIHAFYKGISVIRCNINNNPK